MYISTSSTPHFCLGIEPGYLVNIFTSHSACPERRFNRILIMDASQQTLRITGLPPNCEERDVEHFFNERIIRHHGRQIIERVGPISSHGSGITKRTTVSFSSHNTAQKALDLLETNRRLTAEKGGAGTITLDHTFLDLTTLHSSVNPETGKPDIEYVN